MQRRSTRGGSTSPARPPPAPPGTTLRRRARLLSLALLAAGASATACGPQGGSPAATAPANKAGRPVPVTTVTVARGALVQRVEGTGSLEAYQVVTVAARVDGVVERVGVEEGDVVDLTRELAVIDGTRRALERNLAQAAVDEAQALGPQAAAASQRAKAGVARAAAQHRASESDLAEAEAMLARRQKMRAEQPGVVPEEEVATTAALAARRRDAVGVAQAAENEAAAAVAAAEAEESVAAQRLLSARARLSVADKVLADTVARSPIAGVVRRRQVTLGQYVRAGDPLVEIVDRSRLRARFRVTEAESVPLKKGQEVTFLVPALSGERHAASLIHVDETANAVSRMVECLADVQTPAAALKPGFFVVARVEVRSAPVLHAPETALLSSEQGVVGFVVQDGRAVRRTLRVGLRAENGEVEVLDGLAEGETLIVGGVQAVSDGQAVVLLPPRDGAGAASTPASSGKKS